MLLVDTSVWVDHLRKREPALKTALLENRVLCHPHVVGEIALGNLAQRDKVLGLLQALPRATVADNAEVLDMISHRRLHGHGIGLVDCHLLASILLTPGTALWTRDKRLARLASTLQTTN